MKEGPYITKYELAALKHECCGIKTFVEIGTYTGGTIRELAKGFPKILFYTIDKKIVNFCEENIVPITGDSTEQATADMITDTIDVLFIDGSHSYDDVKKDYQIWSKKVVPNGKIIFHDSCFISPTDKKYETENRDICSCSLGVQSFLDELNAYPRYVVNTLAVFPKEEIKGLKNEI